MVTTLNGKIVFQNTASEYDPLGREHKVSEVLNPTKTVKHQLKFDGVGNTRQAIADSVSFWNTFTASSRPLILNGILNSQGQVLIAPKQGSMTTYQNGYPRTVTVMDKFYTLDFPIVRTMDFDKDGYLSYTRASFLDPLRESTRTYTSRGWPQHTEGTIHFPFPPSPEIKVVLYDATRNDNGWELTTINGDSTTFVDPADYTPMGLMTKEKIVSSIIDPEDPKHPTILTTYLTNIEYVGFETYQLSSIRGYTDNSKTGRGPEAETIILNDANGGAAGTVKIRVY